MADWEARANGRNVHSIRYAPHRGRSKTWRARMLMLSDLHFDSNQCDRDLVKFCLDRAKQDNRPIFINGDSLDVMQCTRDPRASHEGMRLDYLIRMKNEDEKFDGGRYLDLVQDDITDFLKPYAHLIVGIGYGNHETAVVKHRNHDLLVGICKELRRHSGNTHPTPGGYAGWIRLYFSQTASGKNTSTNIYYNHGTGGSSPVSKGIMEFARLAERVIADVYWMGHNHHMYAVPTSRWVLSNKNVPKEKSVLYVRTPSFIWNEGKDGAQGFGVERGHGPRPRGAYWLEHYLTSRSGGKEREMRFHATEVT